MPARPVIINNTPLVALWVLGRLDLLRDLYGEVLMPQAVYNEFLFIPSVIDCPTVKQVLTPSKCRTC